MATPLHSAVHHHFGTMAAGRAKLQPVPRLFQAAKASCLVHGDSQSNETLEFQVQWLAFWYFLQFGNIRRGIIHWTNWITRQMVWNDHPSGASLWATPWLRRRWLQNGGTASTTPAWRVRKGSAAVTARIRNVHAHGFLDSELIGTGANRNQIIKKIHMKKWSKIGSKGDRGGEMAWNGLKWAEKRKNLDPWNVCRSPLGSASPRSFAQRFSASMQLWRMSASTSSQQKLVNLVVYKLQRWIVPIVPMRFDLHCVDVSSLKPKIELSCTSIHSNMIYCDLLLWCALMVAGVLLPLGTKNDKHMKPWHQSDHGHLAPTAQESSSKTLVDSEPLKPMGQLFCLLSLRKLRRMIWIGDKGSCFLKAKHILFAKGEVSIWVRCRMIKRHVWSTWFLNTFRTWKQMTQSACFILCLLNTSLVEARRFLEHPAISCIQQILQQLPALGMQCS